MWKPSKALMDTITHYSSFPATGVSLRQMVQFGQNPSQGKTLHQHDGFSVAQVELFQVHYSEAHSS